jgi:glycosyltransferase involved in cell wall biosynthesis
MNKPLISVLIDSYNYARFIEEAVDSVLSQDFPAEEVEVLVVDDGSTDDTADRVKKYASRVRYLRKENGGQASAFNYGFANVRGDIIFTLDADDYFLPGKLRLVWDQFQRHLDAGMVYHARMELFSDTGRLEKAEFVAVTGFLAHEEKKLLQYVPYPTSCLAFRRSIVERLLPVPETLKLQADGHFVFLMPLIAPVVAVDEPLAVYRVHGQNLFYASETSNLEVKKRYVKSFTTLVREVKAWVRKHKRELKAIETRLYFGHYTLYLEEMRFAYDPPGRLRFFWSLLRQNYIYGRQQTLQFTAYNYLSALPALIFGYKKRKDFYTWRGRTLEYARRIV